MTIPNPYHEGELEVQHRVNQAEMAQINSSVIDKTILDGALRFIEQQPMVVIGSMDKQGRVWNSTLFGNPGFLRAVDDHTLELDISEPRSSHDDPLWHNLLDNPNVGLLVIELGSRRRIRINGCARKISDKILIIDVERAFPNCPKYIQRRDRKKLESNSQMPILSGKHGTALTESQKQLINSADTFFISSAHPDHGIDASHRGGHPGFVHIINEQQLRIPDFSGNSMFNTLGNFISYPYAGLVFIDFENSRVLQLSGRPEILWERDDPQGETGGTKRYWQLQITDVFEAPTQTHFSWELLDASPHIPEQIDNNATSNTVLLRLEATQNETDRIKSFRFRATNGEQLPAFQPGAHLQIKVKLSGDREVLHHYSVLSDPLDRSLYEIAVLKEPQGKGGSIYMHEQINVGDVLEVSAPKNEFPMVAKAEHSILIAGGIGITPIFAMLQKLKSEQQSFELHYTTRELSGLAFCNRIEQLAGEHTHFYASQNQDSQRLDLDNLLAIPKPGVHVYVCGPHGLINAVREITAENHWPLAQIHFESFGAQPLPDDRQIQVHLAKLNKTITVPAQITILDTLLEAGIKVPHDCKRGECTMCTTRVLNGEPDHRDLCLSSEEKASSMCLCVSRVQGDTLELDL